MVEAKETASSTWDQVGALATENGAGTGGILDGTSSEDAKQPWRDEGGQIATAMQPTSVSRRRCQVPLS